MSIGITRITPNPLVSGNTRSQISVGRPFSLLVERELVVSRIVATTNYDWRELKRHKRQGVQGYKVHG